MKQISVRVKITAITVAVILASALSVFAACYPAARKETDRQSVKMMQLVGKDVQNALDEYFIRIEQAVGLAANEATDFMDSVVLVECGAAGSGAQSERTVEQTAVLNAYLTEYCSQIQEIFESVASHSPGVITYYYCINPEISQSVHGFFYSRVGKAGFVEQPPLDARELDPADTEHTTWYYTPIQRGRPSWVGPYTAHFLDEMWICSYLVPIYSAGTLVGVLGMDIALDTLIDQVRPIRVYDTGFASLCNVDGLIYYHPEVEQGSVPELTGLSFSRELLHNEDSGDVLIRYTANGEKRQMSFSTLRNGLKLVVTAPVKEIHASWTRTIRAIVLITAIAIAVFALFMMYAIDLLTKPLQKLTTAARRLTEGDYTVRLDYKSNDEIGELTEAFSLMRDKQKEHIEDLNRRVYTDDLTGLPNMRCFFELAEENRDFLISKGKTPAMLYLNLIGLKHFNRQFGFEEGSRLICAFGEILERHFGRRFMCRFGQDQFAAIADESGLEERLQEIFAECQTANGGISLPVRVGIYKDSIERVEANVAADRAKYACDQRRGTYVSGFTYFEVSMQQHVRELRYIINHLDQALEENWIRVYYQPIIRALNGQVCDEEALARWVDPERGVLSPGAFIPALEDAGLIYKLDLYIVDRVLEKICFQQSAGITVVPHSINLSRSDFDACDIVEEVRKRVDAAGVARDRITIEITESIIGSDFDFMKEQVERFRLLGFPVWMDDFGSGYSSLDVLQSIRFDLIKFDMSFMRRLDESDDGRIILTKLMEMASAIGVDTVCEGVETQEQAQFLQEIGCSRLQGYLFSKPVPYSELLERFLDKSSEFGYEKQTESTYFETVGRVNLYDLGVIAADDNDAITRSFNTLPMGVIEVRGDSCRWIRSNQSYRDFVRRYFGFDLSSLGPEFVKYDASFMLNVVKTCCEQGLRSFYDEKMPDGSTVHSFARRIDENPVNGTVAVAVAVLSISEPDQSTSYADIARALAADYYNIFVVDLDTERFIEYNSTVGGEELAMERHGERFFASVKQDAATRVYKPDRKTFLATFTKESIIRELDEQGVYSITYRLIDGGKPVYANMKVMRMPGGNRIIIGVSIIDAQMKQKEQLDALQRERDALARVMALSDDYLTLYTIDPETGHFVEYRASSDYESLGIPKEGEDFFASSIEEGKRVVCPEDLPEYLRRMTKENVLRSVRETGSFVAHHRIALGGVIQPVTLKIAKITESDGEKLVAGIRVWKDRGQ